MYPLPDIIYDTKIISEQRSHRRITTTMSARQGVYYALHETCSLTRVNNENKTFGKFDVSYSYEIRFWKLTYSNCEKWRKGDISYRQVRSES